MHQPLLGADRCMTLNKSKHEDWAGQRGRQPAPAGAIIRTEQREQHPTHPDVHPAVPKNSKAVLGGEEEGNSCTRMTKSAFTSLRDEGRSEAFPGLFKAQKNNRGDNRKVGARGKKQGAALA